MLTALVAVFATMLAAEAAAGTGRGARWCQWIRVDKLKSEKVLLDLVSSFGSRVEQRPEPDPPVAATRKAARR